MFSLFPVLIFHLKADQLMSGYSLKEVKMLYQIYTIIIFPKLYFVTITKNIVFWRNNINIKPT